MRRLFSVLAAVAITCTGGVVLASPAQADTPGCVTQREYQRAHHGMRMRRVHRIFDTRGRFVDGGVGGFARGYRFCNGGTLTIEYRARVRDGRVIARVASKTRT